MPFWHRPFPNYRQREMVRHIFLALKVLKARGFAAKLSGLGEFIVEYVISGELDRIYDETAN